MPPAFRHLSYSFLFIPSYFLRSLVSAEEAYNITSRRYLRDI